MNQLYELVDTCNDNELIHTITFSDAKKWLLDFWRNDDDMSEVEFNGYSALVEQSETVAELNNYLAGIGYALEDAPTAHELTALQYAEKHGVIEYRVKGKHMRYYETYPSEGTYRVDVDLDSMKETRTHLKRRRRLAQLNNIQ